MARLISLACCLVVLLWGIAGGFSDGGAAASAQDVARAEEASESRPPAIYPASRQVKSPQNGHYYQRIDIPMSWHEAKTLCEQVGGYLATVASAEENQFILTNFATDHVCWLGATDEADEGNWRWVTNEPFEYRNWAPNEPSNQGRTEHYLVMGNAVVATLQGRPYLHYAFGASWNDHTHHGLMNGVPIAFPLCEWNGPPPAAVHERLLAMPDDGVTELNAYLTNLMGYRPDTSPATSQLYWRAPASMREAANQVLQKEQDPLSPAYQSALRILLEDRIGRMPLSVRTVPMDQLATFEMVDLFLRARIETRQLTREDALLALWAARISESTSLSSPATTAFHRYAQLLNSSEVEGVADVARLLEGVNRRLDSTGKPLALQGTTLDGTPLDWNAYRGKRVFVLFWKCDHAASRALMEGMQWYYDGYRDRGFEVVGINLDADREAALRGVKAASIPWHNVWDGAAENRQSISTYYGVVDLPKSFLVDEEGKVMGRDLTPENLGQTLRALLGELRYTESLAAPPYTPRGHLRFLDVPSRANRELTIPTFVGQIGNNLAELPLGEQQLGGVTYRVTDNLIQLGSLYLPELTRRVHGVPVGGKIGKLYFLHGTQWGGGDHAVADMTVIGEYRVHYEDGTLAKIPIRYGESVRDWWNVDESQPTTLAEMAWTGENADSRRANVKIRLYGTGWVNPHPEKSVDSVDLVSANTIAAPFCLAITAEEVAE